MSECALHSWCERKREWECVCEPAREREALYSVREWEVSKCALHSVGAVRRSVSKCALHPCRVRVGGRVGVEGE